MKTIKILIASLLLASQSYALSKSDRNLLIGLTAGTIITALYTKSHNIHVKKYQQKKHHKHSKRRKHSHCISHHKSYKKVDFRDRHNHRRVESHYSSYQPNYKNHYRY